MRADARAFGGDLCRPILRALERDACAAASGVRADVR
jgi:hypothetical protein